MSRSSIEWTEATWNPIAGCTVLSPGCTNCYAMRMASRLAAMGNVKYEGLTRVSGGQAKWNGVVRVDRRALDAPRKWKKGRLIFVNSMSDLFHEAVSLRSIQDVFSVMQQTPQHVYQILTKRADRLKRLSPHLPWPDNIWMGVSVENEDFLPRVDDLRSTSAKKRFLSLEPLLGPVSRLRLEGIHWVIVGGESGPGARAIQPEWIREVRDMCVSQGVAFHFKQWGGVNKKKTGRLLDGRTWDDIPAPGVTEIHQPHLL